MINSLFLYPVIFHSIHNLELIDMSLYKVFEILLLSKSQDSFFFVFIKCDGFYIKIVLK